MAKQKKQKQPEAPLTPRERWLRKKNHAKTVRVIIQWLLLGAFVYFILANFVFPQRYARVEPVTATAEDGTPIEGALPDYESRFITVSYSGISTSEELESKIVSQRAFEEQMAALHASGYVTISQQDILDYYQRHATLPEKAMFIIFEDGILNTATLAQPSLRKYNYIASMCTYALNLTDINSKFATTQDIKKLLSNTYWELGTNGYRLSYINVFDRYGNYFGHLNTNEFVTIDDYLRRDYNHYLMDFLRDEDRLREETVDEMNARFEFDYSQMHDIYNAELGYVPSLYILMHSNTGAFGNDTLTSAKNRDLLASIFGMNFNRQGSCLNNLESSIFDLSRLQSQAYFSTNHLLMRIKDDTGDDVAFVTGDENQAAMWYQDKGVTEYKGHKIILTTDPYDKGQIMLNAGLFSDFDLSVTLQGNKVGVQSIYLRTDRDLEDGVQISLENNNLVVRDLSAGGAELFRLDLFEFDGGATMSEQEHEHNGLVALCEAIIQYDEDAERIAWATERLEKLNNTWPINLAEGGTPYVPDLDISDRDSRAVRVRLLGSRLSVWLDGRTVVENLSVSSDKRGSIALGAEVWKDPDKYSQANLYDDVYDAVFVDPIITDIDDENTIYYAYQLSDLQKLEEAARKVFQSVTNFFLQTF